MRVVRNLLACVVPALCLVACGPALPSDDSCSSPETSGISSVGFVATGGNGGTVADLALHSLIYGPQGGSMVELRFALQGPMVPSCVPFELTVDRCTNLACSEVDAFYNRTTRQSLQTYEDSTGRRTKNYLLQVDRDFGPGALLRVQVEVGTTTNSLLLWLESEGPFMDAGPQDAGPADANFSDANVFDADLSDANLPDAMP